MSLTKKILLSVLGVGVVGSLVGMGTFASFTATVTNPNNSFSTGTLALDTHRGANSFIEALGLKPDDSKTELLEVKNAGSLPIASYTLATTASTSSILDTDPTNGRPHPDGLHLTIWHCGKAQTGTDRSAICSGTPPKVRDNVPIIHSAAPIGSTGLEPGKSDYYQIDVYLPASADDRFQGKTSTIVFTWTGSS